MALFNKTKYEVSNDKTNEIIHKLDQILCNQLALNKRLDEMEKKIEINTGAHTQELAILKEMVKKNIVITPTPSFPLKSTEDMTVMENKIGEDFEKYVDIIKIIISPDGLIKNFCKIIDISIILSHNYDGTQNKKAFKEFKLLNMAIYAVRCERLTEQDYAKKIRNCFKIHKARHFRTMSYNKKIGKI
ncbi:uncharacterized protein LOC105261964 isoform X2 [Musca domestica]|uniref:Uncharacterized protein LOC105261964 isoform X2 n=1 Tax=Musca domestica TaxID=7370 RepID=A0A9J7DJY6_MUSDO|nr:uncharacterized protein LOC105261964 isoform X2 [Musca domestica]